MMSHAPGAAAAAGEETTVPELNIKTLDAAWRVPPKSLLRLTWTATVIWKKTSSAMRSCALSVDHRAANKEHQETGKEGPRDD